MTTKQDYENGMETVPRPDPTVLTTAMLQREIATSREVIETRLDGMDKAIELLQRTTDKFPQHIVEAVDRLQELHTEKFKSIATQFVERDTRTEQTSRDSKVAVDAALQAAKEAVGEQNKSSALAIAKSEAATTKQIDQIGQMIAATNNAMNDKIDDIKTRLTTIESYKKGGYEGMGSVGSIVMGVAAVIAVIVSIVALVFTMNRGA